MENDITEGFVHIYDTVQDNEVEVDVNLEFDYVPAEKMTLNYPGCDEELILEKITACFGEIEVDSISNLDEFIEEALECMHNNAY
jgi:hypothetical protein